MRTFVAIELSEGIRRALGGLMEELRPGMGKIKWVRPDRMHLTLKFLGEVEETQLDPITEKLEDVCRGEAPLSFRAVGIGCFPNPSRPRVIWAGLEGDLERLADLQRQVDDALASLGFPPETRSFSPHVTLGRVKGPVRRELLEKAISAHAGNRFGEETVQEVVFMRSQLRWEGPVYTPISRVKLGG